MLSLDQVYLICVFGSAALMLVLAAYAWRHRNLPAIKAFFVLILGVAEWILAVGFMGISDPEGAAAFWHKAIYLGICVVPLTSLVFFVQFTGRGRWLTRNRIFALSLPLLLIQGLIWTNDLHGRIFSEVTFRRSGMITVRQEAYGDLYWFHSSYGYTLIALGIVYLIWAAWRAVSPFRLQIIVLLLAVEIPLITSVSETLQVTDYIIVPFGFAAMGLIMGWSIFRLRFLDLLPVARSKLVDTMVDPMIAVDNQDRIIDVNPATIRLLAASGSEVATRELIGKTMDEALGEWREQFREFRGRANVKAEIKLNIDGRRRYFDLRVTPILESLNQPRGRLIILREITELKEVQRELRRLATTDTLTGVFNRRQFFDLAGREVERSHRYQLPLSLILIDLDHFKKVNDVHGHIAGDRVLQAFALTCQKNLREIDVFARYGGEEFAALLPETGRAQGREVAERLHCRINPLIVKIADSEIAITASMGIAEYLGEGDTLGGLLQRADRALYAAKAAGRNRIEFWSEPEPRTPMSST